MKKNSIFLLLTPKIDRNKKYIVAMQHLHLKFALNLENLAGEMIDAVSKAWTNPFEAPAVIFPDPKLEQWFRLKWVQKKKSLTPTK